MSPVILSEVNIPTLANHGHRYTGIYLTLFLQCLKTTLSLMNLSFSVLVR